MIAKAKDKKVGGTDDQKNGKKSTCSMGCLVFVGVLVILIGIGIFSFHKITSEAFESFDEDLSELIPEGYETPDMYKAIWDLMGGVISGEIEPERFMNVSFELAISMMDGVLTYEELSNIIRLIYDLDGMKI